MTNVLLIQAAWSLICRWFHRLHFGWLPVHSLSRTSTTSWRCWHVDVRASLFPAVISQWRCFQSWVRCSLPLALFMHRIEIVGLMRVNQTSVLFIFKNLVVKAPFAVSWCGLEPMNQIYGRLTAKPGWERHSLVDGRKSSRIQMLIIGRKMPAIDRAFIELPLPISRFSLFRVVSCVKLLIRLMAFCDLCLSRENSSCRLSWIALNANSCFGGSSSRSQQWRVWTRNFCWGKLYFYQYLLQFGEWQIVVGWRGSVAYGSTC